MKKRIASALLACTLLLLGGCVLRLPLKPDLGQGLDGGVLSVTYSDHPGDSNSGAIVVVNSTATDARHSTTWKLKTRSTNIWSTAHDVGCAPVTIATGKNYADYEILFTSKPPDAFTRNNPSPVRIFPNKLATVKIHYYR